MEIHRVKTMEELEKCFDIRKEVFVKEQQVPQDLEMDEYDENPDACNHVLMTLDGRPVATGRWRFYDEETAKLQRVAVLKALRGTGLGKRLILEMEGHAREAGACYSMLDGQCHAEDFYRKLGYETISDEPFLDAGILHVRMRKKLQG
jgi:predicted GNAT family N-acyltransferase